MREPLTDTSDRHGAAVTENEVERPGGLSAKGLRAMPSGYGDRLKLAQLAEGSIKRHKSQNPPRLDRDPLIVTFHDDPDASTPQDDGYPESQRGENRVRPERDDAGLGNDRSEQANRY